MIAIDSFLSSAIPSYRKAVRWPANSEVSMERLWIIAKVHTEVHGEPPSKFILTPDHYESMLQEREMDRRYMTGEEPNSDFNCLRFVFRSWTILITQS